VRRSQPWLHNPPPPLPFTPFLGELRRKEGERYSASSFGAARVRLFRADIRYRHKNIRKNILLGIHNPNDPTPPPLPLLKAASPMYLPVLSSLPFSAAASVPIFTFTNLVITRRQQRRRILLQEVQKASFGTREKSIEKGRQKD